MLWRDGHTPTVQAAVASVLMLISTMLTHEYLGNRAAKLEDSLECDTEKIELIPATTNGGE